MRARPFLRGPVDWPWILSAMRARGSALSVGVFVWFISGIKKSRTVKVRLASLPIGRGAATRGLHALERAGLISVKRTKGHWPSVTIVECRNQGERT